jgi:hypothetical protein
MILLFPLLRLLLVDLSEHIILQRVSNVICIGKVEPSRNLDFFESLYVFGLFFFAVVTQLLEQRLNSDILDLVDVVSADLGDLLLGSD